MFLHLCFLTQSKAQSIIFIMRSDDHMGVSEDKSVPVYNDDKGSSSDAEVGRASTEVGTVETTKRGLKARHAQMIALGGTIG